MHEKDNRSLIPPEGKVHIPDLKISTPHRKSSPRVIESKPGVHLPLKEEEIRKIVGQNGIYYEGVDHSEGYTTLKDFIETTGTNPDKLVLVLVDAHDDVTQWRHDPEIVRLGTWVRSAAENKLFNTEIGAFWIYRDYPEFMGLVEGINAATIDNFEDSGVRLNLLDFDRVEDDPEARMMLQKIYDYKRDGFSIALNIDADAGQMEEPDIDYDRDLANTPWLAGMCTNSDTTMIFHSPDFSNSEYSNTQAAQFQEMVSQG